jgi:hypothetical protein
VKTVAGLEQAIPHINKRCNASTECTNLTYNRRTSLQLVGTLQISLPISLLGERNKITGGRTSTHHVGVNAEAGHSLHSIFFTRQRSRTKGLQPGSQPSLVQRARLEPSGVRRVLLVQKLGRIGHVLHADI